MQAKSAFPGQPQKGSHRRNAPSAAEREREGGREVEGGGREGGRDTRDA